MARHTPGGETGRHSADSVLPGARRTHLPGAGRSPPSSGHTVPPSAGCNVGCNMACAVSPGAGHNAGFCAGTVSPDAGCNASCNSCVQQHKDSTGALPPDKVRLLLHTLGLYLGVQLPLPGSQEDTLPEVQQTSTSHKNPSGVVQKATENSHSVGERTACLRTESDVLPKGEWLEDNP